MFRSDVIIPERRRRFRGDKHFLRCLPLGVQLQLYFAGRCMAKVIGLARKRRAAFEQLHAAPTGFRIEGED